MKDRKLILKAHTGGRLLELAPDPCPACIVLQDVPLNGAGDPTTREQVPLHVITLQQAFQAGYTLALKSLQHTCEGTK